MYFQLVMAQDVHYHSKMGERENSEEIVGQSKTKNQLCKLQTLHLHSNVKTLFIFSAPFSFVDYNILLSLGLVPFPVSSSPQQVFHDAGISNILGGGLLSNVILHPPLSEHIHVYTIGSTR